MIATGCLIAKIDSLVPGECYVWLVRTRKMRTQQLCLLRTLLKDPHLAIAYGRREEGNSDEEAGDVDSLVASYVEGWCKPIAEELALLMEELLAIQKT